MSKRQPHSAKCSIFAEKAGRKRESTITAHHPITAYHPHIPLKQ
ncbi:hypothetical protein HMPREF9303_1332 [Prevotella denticola CRIS 18C-A]|uniref:Uncharacterized protein n=1 Tax=Prevotella denticola CRIS 18C-A TaxID=944557 RepID=F0H799_9BACT|nr:hypothetical protein HMPREF9303_1332 [Prevotella denticola CRIS 18C-A]